jgi:hypothetical protein
MGPKIGDHCKYNLWSFHKKNVLHMCLLFRYKVFIEAEWLRKRCNLHKQEAHISRTLLPLSYLGDFKGIVSRDEYFLKALQI